MNEVTKIYSFQINNSRLGIPGELLSEHESVQSQTEVSARSEVDNLGTVSKTNEHP